MTLRECWAEWECFAVKSRPYIHIHPNFDQSCVRAMDGFVGYNKLSLQKGFEGKLRVGYVVALSNNVMDLNKQLMQHIFGSFETWNH